LRRAARRHHRDRGRLPRGPPRRAAGRRPPRAADPGPGRPLAELKGIGVDEVEVPRFARSLERTPTLAARLFTDGERAYAGRAKAGTAAQRLAARFAAKEAVLK